MPDSLADLARLGVEVEAADGAEFRGIRFVNHGIRRAGYRGAETVATACFPALANGDLAGRRAYGVGVRRQALHRRLVEAAVAAGVQLRWGCGVQLKGTLEDGKISMAGEMARAGLVVGADGLSSGVRRWAGLERGREVSRRYGFRRHFRVAPWSEFVEVHWGVSGQAYVTPTGANEICVAGVVRDPHCRLGQLLQEMPGLRERLGNGSGVDSERGCLTTTRRLRRVVSEVDSGALVALVGDASGSADAITGEGLGVAFRQALLLAQCVEAGDLRRYERMHPATLKLPQTMARVMLGMDRFAGLRDRAIGMLAGRPELFARLLGVHLGVESVGGFVLRRGLDVGLGLARPGLSVPPARAVKP